MSITPIYSRTILALGATVVIAGSLCAGAQPRRGRAVGGKRQAQTETRNQPFHFGDITISNYQSMSGKLGVSYEARGPNTTVDVADPKQPNVKTRLTATVLKAYIDQSGNGNDVERIEATGSVKFHSTRPATGGGTQILDGSGAKAIYYRKENRVVLEGPIQYQGRQVDPSGVVVQSVRGTARSAEYDEVKQVISLDGDVNATLTTPSLKEPATLEGASDLRVDMSKQPLDFDVKGGKINFVPKEPKKEPGKTP